MFNSIFTTSTETVISTELGCMAVAAALALGLLVSIVYMLSFKKERFSRNYAITMALLPAMVAAVIMLVGTDVARAFSLAGIFSLVRFRSAPGNARDISYVFFAMTIGLACGMGLIVFGVAVAFIIGLAFLLYYRTGFAVQKNIPKTLKITIPETLNYEGAFDDLFEKYTSSSKLNGVKTTNLGTLFELNYGIALKTGVSEKEFIDDLRCRNGNLNIVINSTEVWVEKTL